MLERRGRRLTFRFVLLNLTASGEVKFHESLSIISQLIIRKLLTFSAEEIGKLMCLLDHDVGESISAAVESKISTIVDARARGALKVFKTENSSTSGVGKENTKLMVFLPIN